MSGYFKCLIYKITLKVHKFVVYNLVNFVFFAYLCIRNQVKKKQQWKRHSYMVCRLPKIDAKCESGFISHLWKK